MRCSAVFVSFAMLLGWHQALRAESFALSPSMVVKVKEAVVRSLKDPDSAKFSQKILAERKGNILHVCGTVNAKNSFGGYTGEKLFYVMGSASAETFELVSSGSSETDQKVTFVMCTENGVF
jgi:hypothetical protein